jgi:hypothetical protein
VNTAGLSLDQAPPLAVPAGFFIFAPLSLISAGILMAKAGSTLFTTGWMPATQALTHLGTLGLLGSCMLGALYQMCPVVAGVNVPATRLAHVVQLAWGIGIVALVAGLSGAASLPLAIKSLSVALALFLGPIVWALARARAGRTVTGMRLAVLALLGVAGLGLVLAARVPLDRMVVLRLHLVLGLGGWVGGLLSAVSWEVVPMFYLASTVGQRSRRLVVVLLAAGLLLPWWGLAVGSSDLVALGAAPLVVAVWLVHPLLTLVSIRRRRRRRSDPSMRAWQSAMIAAMICGVLAWPAHAWSDPRAALLFGWVAIVGWAGLAVHGMLGRILPFLVWFHRFSHRAGLEPVPSMKDLLPDWLLAGGLWLHGTVLLVGCTAVLSGSDLLARLTGTTLILTGLWMAGWMVKVLGSGLRSSGSSLESAVRSSSGDLKDAGRRPEGGGRGELTRGS